MPVAVPGVANVVFLHVDVLTGAGHTGREVAQQVGVGIAQVKPEVDLPGGVPIAGNVTHGPGSAGTQVEAVAEPAGRDVGNGRGRVVDKLFGHVELPLLQPLLVLSVLGLFLGLLALLLVEVHVLAGAVIGLDAHHAQVQLGLQPAAIKFEQVIFQLEQAQLVLGANGRVGKGVALVEAGLGLVAYRAGVAVAAFGLLDLQEGDECRGHAFEAERVLKIVPRQFAFVPEFVFGELFAPGDCREQEGKNKKYRKPFHKCEVL